MSYNFHFVQLLSGQAGVAVPAGEAVPAGVQILVMGRENRSRILMKIPWEYSIVPVCIEPLGLGLLLICVCLFLGLA